MTGRGLRAGFLTLLLLACAQPSGADNDLFIGQVRVEDARRVQDGDAALNYRVLHEDPAGLQSQLAAWVFRPDAVDGGVAFSLADYPAAVESKAGARHSASTFLVDYLEPSVQALAGQIESRYGKQPSPGELEQFVYDFIEDKNGAHGFDVASQVATSRAGDCTEHAVLLAAVLRMFGYPSRAVTGLYVSLEAPVMGYGHAWTEYHDGKRWSALDATRISDRVGAQHLPMGLVVDESIAYSIGLISVLQSLAIERVVVY